MNTPAGSSNNEVFASFGASDAGGPGLYLANGTSQDTRVSPLILGRSIQSSYVGLTLKATSFATQDTGTQPMMNFDASQYTTDPITGPFAAIATRPLFNFSNKGISVATILANGNFGVGTTLPSSAIALGGDTARVIGMERNSTGAGSGLTIAAGGAFAGTSNQDGGQLSLSAGTATGNGGSTMAFKVAQSFQGSGSTDRTPTTALFIDKNLRVGMGNGAQFPTAPLYVSAYSNSTIRVSNPGISNGTTAGINFEALNAAGTKFDYGSILGGVQSNTVGTEGGFLAMSTTKSGTLAEALRIDSSGNVGIGTTTPVAMLNVHGGAIVSDTITNAIAISSIDFSTGNVQVSNNATNNAAIKLCGLKDGGSYSLVMKAQPNGSLPTFSAYSDAACTTSITYVDSGGVSLAVSSPTAIYTVIRAGATAYVMVANGFTH